MKKTKMVCTIGPKSESKEMLTKLSNAGMNVMRLNFSHGDYEEHGGRINTIRDTSCFHFGTLLKSFCSPTSSVTAFFPSGRKRYPMKAK